MAGPSRGRSVEEKVGDWDRAYRAIAEAITDERLKQQLDAVINTPLTLPDNEVAVLVFNARMNASMALARLISANNRAAGTIAALITQTGIKPAAIDYGDDT